MLGTRIAQVVVFAAATLIGVFPNAANAQLANVTITVHVAPTPKIYRTQVAPGTTVEKAMQQAKMQYTATWYPSVGGNAAMILENTPSTTNGAFSSQYWWLCINDVSASAGMSAQPVKDGDDVGWYYVSDAKCPKDAAARSH